MSFTISTQQIHWYVALKANFKRPQKKKKKPTSLEARIDLHMMTAVNYQLAKFVKPLFAHENYNILKQKSTELWSRN